MSSRESDASLPPELQHQILRLAIPPFKRCSRSETVERNREISVYSLVNTAWREWAQPEIFVHLQVEELFQLRNLLDNVDTSEGPDCSPQALTLGRPDKFDGFTLTDLQEVKAIYRKFPVIPQIEIVGAIERLLSDVLAHTCAEGLVSLHIVPKIWPGILATPIPASPFTTLRHLHITFATALNFSIFPNLTAIFSTGGYLSSESATPVFLPPKLIALGTWSGEWSPAPPSVQLLELRSDLWRGQTLPPSLRIWRISTLQYSPYGQSFFQQTLSSLASLPKLERLEMPGFWKTDSELMEFKAACLSIKPDLKINYDDRLGFGGHQGYDRLRETGYWHAVRELEARQAAKRL